MNAPHETPIMKKQTVNARVRLKVTTCLYLKPNKRARSLSTLIAVDIEMDITHNAGIAGNKNCVVAVVENIPVHLYHPRRSKENSSEKWLRNKADAEISDCQSSKQEFCWWMKRRLFMKSNKYQSIAQCCRYVQDWPLMRCTLLMIGITKCPHWSIFTKKHINLSYMKKYENVK